MKTGILYLSLAVISVFSLSSCRKDYTCTCNTTTAGTISSSEVKTTQIHNLPHQYHGEARRACRRFELEANSNSLSTTNCDL